MQQLVSRAKLFQLVSVMLGVSIVFLAGCSDPFDRVVTIENNQFLSESTIQETSPSIDSSTLGKYENSFSKIRYGWRWSQIVLDNHLTVGALCDPISVKLLHPGQWFLDGLGFRTTSIHKSEDEVLFRGWTYHEMRDFALEHNQFLNSLEAERGRYCAAYHSFADISVAPVINAREKGTHVTFKITNYSQRAVAKVSILAKIYVEGRSTPLATEDFSYPVTAGLEPGESITRRWNIGTLPAISNAIDQFGRDRLRVIACHQSGKESCLDPRQRLTLMDMHTDLLATATLVQQTLKIEDGSF